MAQIARRTAPGTPVELAVLRHGLYELEHRLDTPYSVVLNEHIELAKKYGATDGHKFVNAVLDKYVSELRATEVASHKSH